MSKVTGTINHLISIACPLSIRAISTYKFRLLYILYSVLSSVSLDLNKVYSFIPLNIRQLVYHVTVLKR
jgi:hypothetical protein